MKVCPECGTQYEDHVPTCIADGAALVAERVRAEPTPRPAPLVVPPPRRGSSAGLVLAVAVVLFVVSGLAATVALVVTFSDLVGSSSVPQPVPVASPRPEPTPEPTREQPPVEVMLVSNPEGAKVYENDQFVCETPCTVLHPAHVQLPRQFVFRAEGHKDRTVEMTDVNQPITVELTRIRAATSTAPQSNPAVPRPSIGRER
ncbi:MAG: PEGA domain-containing protein [Myxococcota bacterium]